MGRKHHNRNHAKHKTHEHDPVTDNLISILSRPRPRKDKNAFSILTDDQVEAPNHGTCGELDPDAFNSSFGIEEYLSDAYIPGAPMDDAVMDEMTVQYLARKCFRGTGIGKFDYFARRQIQSFSEIEKYTKYSTIKKQAQKGKSKMARIMTIKNSPHLFILPSVAEKMESLIFGAGKKEIAWHGFVRRIGEPEKMIFELYDIIVYPQTVSGATTTSDEEEYAKWYIKDVMPRDDFENFKFHGHSHVDFGCTPSGTDNKFRNDILMNITAENDDYYIFMIKNKKGEYTIQLFYPKDNIIFEGTEKVSDIFLHYCSYEDYEGSISWATEEIHKNVKEEQPKTSYYNSGYGSGYESGKVWDAKINSWVWPSEKKLSPEEEWRKEYGGSKEYGYGPKQIYFTGYGYRANGKWHDYTEAEKEEYRKDSNAMESRIKAAFYKACNEAEAAEKATSADNAATSADNAATSADNAATSAVASDTQAPVLVKADGKTPLSSTEPAKVITTTTEGGNSTWKEQNPLGQKESPSTALTPLQQHMMALDRD